MLGSGDMRYEQGTCEQTNILSEDVDLKKNTFRPEPP